MKIDHIGIATRGIDETARFWRAALALDITDTEEVAEQKVRVAMLAIGESRIELLEATSDDSPISKFLEKRGPGIHHIAVRVDDIRGTLAELKQKVSAIKLALPLFAVAAVFALLSLFVLTGALVFVVGQAIGIGWALLVIGVLYLIIAGACAWIGISELSSAGVAPKRTLEVLKQDQVWLQTEARSV